MFSTCHECDLDILRHSSTHVRHTFAHCLHISMSNLSHSEAQASQMSAHCPQILLLNSLSLDIYWEDRTQIPAQSRQSWIHFVILFMSSACRQQLLTQISRASKQALQAYIQLWYYSFCNKAVTCNCIAKYLIATNNP